MAGENAQGRNDYTGLILAGVMAPVLIAFMYFGKGEIGRAVCIDLGSVLIAVRFRWNLRHRFWFWATLVLLVAAHIPLLLMINWPSGWVPAAIALPFAVADCFITLGAISLVQKLMGESVQDN